MAQLLVSAAGAAIGFYLGGPTGAQIGWAAGSMLGASLGPGVQGPRLSDTNVQVSSYGAAIGMVWGGVRKSGNVFWSTRLQETEHEEGGKGGPSVTTYSYRVSCAVGVAEGSQGAIRRMWADAKLVYDASPEADAETQAMSSAFARYFAFYPGDEDQLPDPTIESFEGVGNVPGYRGTCYVVFTDLPLADYGNRVPNFSFELTSELVAEQDRDDLQPLQIGPWEVTGQGIPQHSLGGARYTIDDGLSYFDTLDEALEALTADFPGFTFFIGYYTSLSGILSTFSAPGGAQETLNSGFGARFVYLAFNVEQPSAVVFDGLGIGNTDQEWCVGMARECEDPGPPVMMSSWPKGITGGGGDSQGHTGIGRMFPPGADLGSAPEEYGDPSLVVGANCVVSGICEIALQYPVSRIVLNKFIRVERLPALQEKACYPGDPRELGIAELPGNPLICYSVDGVVSPNFDYVLDTGTFHQLYDVDLMSGAEYERMPTGPILRSGDPDYNNEGFWTAAAAAAGIDGEFGVDYPITRTVAAAGSYTVEAVPPGSVVLGTIVRDICSRSGLADEELDVSELTDEVLGYQIARLASARSGLEQLRQAFWFDAVESGDLIRFVKRGAEPAAIIPFDDLGAGEEEAVSPVEPTRGQETELPASVAVAYSAFSADYQTGTQTSRRMATISQQQVGIELAVVMTDQHAANVADVLMYDAWTSRTERPLSLSRKWCHLEPTDVITFNDGEFDCTVRIIDKDEDGPIVKFVTRDEDAASYAPQAAAAVTPSGGSAISFIGPTNLMLLDIPLLREEDDSFGMYAAARAFVGSWPGARAYRSADGASFIEAADLVRTGVMGYAVDALPDFDGGNVVDEANGVTVRLYGGALASVTRAELLNNSNAAVLGDEIIQFRSAALVAELTYRLTGLLRGRLGTEQHMGRHAVRDRFVLLRPAALHRISDSLARRDVAQIYKAVTFGQSLEDAATTPFTNTGASLKPLSPVHLSAQPIPTGGMQVRWVRRTRVGGSWSDGVDVPLGEATEAYTVELRDPDGVLISSSLVTEPAAQVGGLTRSGTLEQPAFGVQALPGGELAGLRESTTQRGGAALRFTDDFSFAGSVAMPITGAHATQLLAVGSDLLITASAGTLPSWLYKVSAASITIGGVMSPSASYEADAAADLIGGVAFDGTDVWVAQFYTGTLVRLDADDLSVIDTFSMAAGIRAVTYSADEHALYIANSATARVQVFDIATQAVVRTIPTNYFPTFLLVVGDFLYVDASTAAIYDRSTGVLLRSLGGIGGVANGKDFARSFVDVGSVVLYADFAGDRLVGLDPETGETTFAVDVPDITEVAGAAGARVFVNTQSTTGAAPETIVYDFASALTGYTVTVSQISATVGPGFPATITL